MKKFESRESERGLIGSILLKNSLLGTIDPVSYTHLRAHETEAELVCRHMHEKKK